MSRTPSPFDYGSRSDSSPIPFSEPPNYCNYTGHFAPSLVPHATFPFVEGFAPNFRLSATAAVPYSAAPSSVATSEIGPSQSSLGRNSKTYKIENQLMAPRIMQNGQMIKHWY